MINFNFILNILSIIGINPIKKIIFEDGSSVEWLNREAIKVTIDNKSVSINFMFDWDSKNASARTFNKNELAYWDAPDNTLKISSIEKEKIIDRIKKYCIKRRIALAVE